MTDKPMDVERMKLADDILLRIAKRYANCEVNIYPNYPELTPVEAVLRCAQQEGFVLTGAVPQTKSVDVERTLRELITKWREGKVRVGTSDMQTHGARWMVTLCADELEGAVREAYTKGLAGAAPPAWSKAENGETAQKVDGKWITGAPDAPVEGKQEPGAEAAPPTLRLPNATELQRIGGEVHQMGLTGFTYWFEFSQRLIRASVLVEPRAAASESTELLRGFNLGLERAAEYVSQHDNLGNIAANDIRALKLAASQERSATVPAGKRGKR